MTENDEMLQDRFTSHEIFERVIVHADEEISRGTRELLFSSVAAGFSITLTFILYVSLYATYGSESILSAALYPLGFVFIILGNYQLFTENTLPPVALIFERMASIPALLYMWLTVLLGNFTGGVLGAVIISQSGILSSDEISAAIEIGTKGIETGVVPTFFNGVFAGLVVAGVVWLDFSFENSISRLILIYLAFISIPVGDFFHVVVSSVELSYLILIGEAAVLNGITSFILPVLLGNIVGGVFLVTIVNYFQTSSYIQEDASRRLSFKDWFSTYDTGRQKEEIFGEDTKK